MGNERCFYRQYRISRRLHHCHALRYALAELPDVFRNIWFPPALPRGGDRDVRIIYVSFQAYLSSRPATHVPVPDSFWHSREWANHVKYYVSRYRRISAARLNHHDWDDIAQIAMIHIWKKRALYDSSKPLKPWLKTVALSQVKNEIRNRTIYGRTKCAQLRHNLEYPYPLIAKFVNVARGVEEVVYEPDAIDPRTLRSELTLEDFPRFNERDTETLATLLDCPVPARVVKRAKKKGRLKRGDSTLSRLYESRNRLRAIYTEVLNAK